MTFCFTTGRDHAKVWIGERQLGRRNLTDDQRSVIANEVREWKSAIAVTEHAKVARAAVEARNPVSAQKKADTKAKSAHVSAPTRTSVAKAAKLPERKIRLAQEIKKAQGSERGMLHSLSLIRRMPARRRCSMSKEDDIREAGLAVIEHKEATIRFDDLKKDAREVAEALSTLSAQLRGDLEMIVIALETRDLLSGEKIFTLIQNLKVAKLRWISAEGEMKRLNLPISQGRH